MRFLFLIRVDESAGKKPGQRLIDDMTQLMTEMRADAWRGMGGGM